MHLSSDPTFWYAARASGVAAYVALTAVVVLGLALGGKATTRRWPRFTVEDIHRFGGLLVGSLIGIHVLTIAIDSFSPSISQLIIPFTSWYRPLWTGLGIIAGELLIVLAITNRYRRRLPYRFWRRAHYVNFLVWALASLHGLYGGTDRGATWLAIIYGISVASVLVLLIWRFGSLPAPATAAVGAFVLVGLPLLVMGGGTPAHSTAKARDAASANETMTGTIVRKGTAETQVVSFVGRTPSPQALLVRADLLVAQESVQQTSLQLEYPSGDVCTGSVTDVGGNGFTGTCRLPDGEHRTIDASWSPSAGGTGVTGTIRLSD